jgi:hypothetical protein
MRMILGGGERGFTVESVEGHDGTVTSKYG